MASSFRIRVSRGGPIANPKVNVVLNSFEEFRDQEQD